MSYARKHKRYVWNRDNQRFEAVPEKETISEPEENTLKVCREHMPSHWLPSYLWLWEYNGRDPFL